MTAHSRPTIATLGDIEVEVTAVLGRAQARVADVLDYEPGSIVALEGGAEAPVALRVNGAIVAMGEAVVADDGTLAVRITEIVLREPRAEGPT